MAAIYRRGKLCNCCHARENLWRLKYKRGKLCNCYHALQSLWWLQYKCRKLCNWCHARQKLWRLQAREYAADAKRGNTRKLPMQTYALFQEWEAHSCLDMFAQNCLDLGGCVLDISSHFFIDKLKLWLKRFTQSIHCFNFKIWDWRFDWSRSSKDPADPH